MDRCGVAVRGTHERAPNSSHTKVKMFAIFFSNTRCYIHSFIFDLGGGATSAHSLAFIKNQFIITANSMKPLLHIWPVNNQEQIQSSRFVMPGKVTALAVSPDGNYCIAAVSETIYIWQICSGRMLAVLSRHYQSVTSIKFTDDGSHFCTAAHDGMLLVWKLSAVLAFNTTNNSNQQATPLYSFSDHALPISDIHIGIGGLRSYLTTVSLDRTCKIYDLSNGALLLSLVFPEALTSVTVDHLDTKVYVGSNEGNIFEFNLQSPPRMKEYHLSETSAKNKFHGHKGAVTTLSISLDGESLISGGNDENVILWHIPSKQLIRTLPHKGPITNAFFTLAPKCMFDQEIKLTLISSNFKRMLDSDIGNDDHAVEILVKYPIEDESDVVSQSLNNNCGGGGTITEESTAGSTDQLKELESLREEVKQLRKANKGLYEYTMKSILMKDN